MIRALIFLLYGCGRLGFDSGTDGRVDTATDTNMIDSPACVLGPFSPPLRLPSVNSAVDDWAPAISADDLTLYFYSLRTSLPGSPDIWRATRTSPGGDFGPPTVISEVSSTPNDETPRVTADELVLVLTRGAGAGDLFIANRPDRGSAFSTPVPIAELNTVTVEDALWISHDGLRGVFSSARGTDNDLYTTSRPDRASAFGNVQRIVELASLATEATPALSADELEIFFVSDRGTGVGMADIWRATRPAVDQPFSPPENVTVLNSVNDDYAPFLSADGLRLYYSYSADVTGGDSDIWVATRSCL